LHQSLLNSCETIDQKHIQARREIFDDKIKFSQKDGYYSIVYLGEYTLDGMVTLGNMLVDYYRATGSQFALVDISAAEGSLSIMDRYYLADLMRERWSKQLTVSLVLRTSQVIKVLGFFWQKLANHQGFKVNIEFDLEQAKSWLFNQMKPNKMDKV
jgi:hypothetical protein